MSHPRWLPVVAVAVSLVAFAGEGAAVAATSDRAIVVGELRPMSGEREVGVAHVKPRADAPDGLMAVFANVDPGARYVLALSREGCSQQPEPAAVLRRDVASGESTGIVVKGGTATELRDRPLRRMRSVVLFGADRKPRACGRLSVGRPIADSTETELVSGELRPLNEQSAVGIGHLRFRPGGPDSVFAVFINLDAKERYSLGLSRTRCSGADRVQTSPIDTTRATAGGAAVFSGRTDVNLKPNHLSGARSMLLAGPDQLPWACGPAQLMSSSEVDTW